VLYVDEINLLPDALIDSLLDAAASGVNVVERDGISHRYAARFVLVGTMNPEEGTLRPQLLDRFGLCVQLRNIEDPAERQAIVRARLAFDADPQGFRSRHAGAETELAAALARARAVVADVSALPYGDEVHEAVSALCIASQVDGLRADLVMLRSARALAAWDGAAAITADHVQRVAEAVLLHRRKPEAEGIPPAAEPAPAAQNTKGDANTNGAGRSYTAGDQDWGALPPEPVGIERVKPLRPLIPSQQATQQATPKKA
jgi:magnesium chelatase subunit I